MGVKWKNRSSILSNPKRINVHNNQKEKTIDLMKIPFLSVHKSYHPNDIRSLLWEVIINRKGGWTRAQIINALKEKPCNASQLARAMGYNHTTIEYHLRILEKNDLISSVRNDSGDFSISSFLSRNYVIFDEVWKQICHFDSRYQRGHFQGVRILNTRAIRHDKICRSGYGVRSTHRKEDNRRTWWRDRC